MLNNTKRKTLTSGILKQLLLSVEVYKKLFPTPSLFQGRIWTSCTCSIDILNEEFIFLLLSLYYNLSVNSRLKMLPATEAPNR
jgi:hypothetical protein